MGLLEIVLLVIGLLIFSLSFIIPEHKKNISSEDKKIAEELIRELVDDQLSLVSRQIEEVSDERSEEHMERLERRMERLSNEKILAVGEYSDTVLADIKKGHDEVVFLYDMLNAKHKVLNDLIEKIDQSSIGVKKELASANSKEIEGKDSVDKENTEVVFKPLQPKIVEVKRAEVDERQMSRQIANNQVKRAPSRTKKSSSNSKTSKKNVAIQFSKNSTMGQNSNDRILQLHKDGKSNMVIAKELGLGIGEVKLVIDLFKGV